MNSSLEISLFLGIFLFSFLYCSLYMLRDFYFATQNFQMKKYINKILPFFTKYNSFFLIFTSLFLIFSIYNIYIQQLLLFIIIIIIIFSFIFIYIPIKNFTSTKYLRFLSYVLFISILLVPLL